MLDDTMKLAILEKMGEQLQGIADTLEKTQPVSMSKVTYHNTLRDVRAQLEAIRWAHSNCVFIISETERLKGEGRLIPGPGVH